MSMCLGLVVDPLEKLNLAGDTSLIVAAEARRRGHRVVTTTLDDLYVEKGRTWAIWRELDYTGGGDLMSCVSEPFRALADDCDVIFLRKDPPVDTSFLHHTYLFDLCSVPVLNSPRGMREINEKLFILNFPELIAETFVTRNTDEIVRRVNESGKRWVIKPLHLCGGRGIAKLTPDTDELIQQVQETTENGHEFVMVQEFLDKVYHGDKRIFMLDGQAIGAINRVPAQGEFRANLFQGGQPEPCEITEHEQFLVKTVAEKAKHLDVPISCIDVIDGYLSEFNVTSPTGIVQINQLSGSHCEALIVDYLERRARQA